jgi:hypothetical protein
MCEVGNRNRAQKGHVPTNQWRSLRRTMLCGPRRARADSASECRELLCLGQEVGGRDRIRFTDKGGLSRTDAVTRLQTSLPVGCFLRDVYHKPCLAKQLVMSLDLRWPPRRGSLELPGRKDEASTWPQDASICGGSIEHSLPGTLGMKAVPRLTEDRKWTVRKKDAPYAHLCYLCEQRLYPCSKRI